MLPVLIGALILLQLINPWQGWMILLVGLGGAWLIAWLWARALAHGLLFRREMRYGWAQVGDRLEERFTLQNTAFAPALWVEVIDHTALPEYQAGRVTGVDSRSQTQWRTQSVCTRRGVFTLGPTTLRSGDVFGIYSVTVESSSSTTLMVLPPIIPLPHIEVAPGGRAGEGRPRTNAPEQTVSAATVREYSPGDSLRHIHWLTTARRGSFFVRLFDNTPAGHWWIILDMDRAAHVGQGQDSTEEHAITLAASLADAGLRAGHSVGLIAFGDELVWLPPRNGDPQRWSVLRALALLKPGSVKLEELLERVRPTIGLSSSVIIITPAIAPVGKASPGWLARLLMLRRRGIVPTVLLLDAQAYVEDSSVYQSAAHTAERLAGFGIVARVIDRSTFNRLENKPGHEGEWEWLILPTGRVAPVRRPSNLDWRALS
ncbi:MAG: DUF58 domain-containing protein [Anaerolineae bacterium]|nr:DUF58 domain-containing protein [Thermoflexales bacterium]MDW8408630.1 DUF58 domain-containing protein [Anaerolineae bacterium]